MQPLAKPRHESSSPLNLAKSPYAEIVSISLRAAVKFLHACIPGVLGAAQTGFLQRFAATDLRFGTEHFGNSHLWRDLTQKFRETAGSGDTMMALNGNADGKSHFVMLF